MAKSRIVSLRTPRPVVKRSAGDPKRMRASMANDEWNEALGGVTNTDPDDEVVQPARTASLDPNAPRIPSPPTPLTPAATPQTLALSLRLVTNGDCDRLWDWARENPEGAVRFFGAMPEFSKALYDWVDALLLREGQAQAEARIRSVYVGDTHIGLVTLAPIFRTAQPYGFAHCFLAPKFEGSLATLMPALVEAAADIEPTLTLNVYARDIAFARLLEPHGFSTQIILSRPPNSTRG